MSMEKESTYVHGKDEEKKTGLAVSRPVVSRPDSCHESSKHPGLVLTPQGWREPYKPDPHRLPNWHNARSRCIYFITINAYQDRRVFGQLAGGLDNPHIALSPLGKIVDDSIRTMPKYHDDISIIEHTTMTTHVHFVLFMKQRNDEHIGEIIANWKKGVNSAAREAGLLESGCGHGVFEKGYVPQILHGPELEEWLGYIRSNPYRLAYRNAFARYYNVQRNVQIGSHTYDMVGNSDLLKRPLVQVLVHRSEFDKATNKPTSDAARDRLNSLILQARKGAVLISPFISPGELAIRDVAIKEGLPIIMMLNHGLNDKYKPSKAFFDMCHKGNLLQITPWTYKYGEDEKGYDRFHRMNDLVAEICVSK